MRRLLLLLLVVSCVACGSDTQSGVRDPVGTGPTPLPTPAPLAIEYRVTGTIHNTDIVYFTSATGTSEVTTDLPWSIRFQSADLHPFVYLSAATPITNAESGSLAVQVYVNNVLFREARGSGWSITVTASGEVP